MKKLLIAICAIFVGVVHADEININWMNGSTLYDTSTCTVGGDLNTPPAPQKYGYNFLGWVSFTPIEYIESDGTQYINTGISPNQDTRFMMTVLLNVSYVEGEYLFGTSGCMIIRGLNNGGFRFYYGPTSSFLNVHVGRNPAFEKYTLDFNKNICEVYDKSGKYVNSATFNAPDPFNCSSPLYIGRTNGVTNGVPMKIYSVKIWDNDELVRNFIPVLDGNGVACLYDLVSNEYFYNAGTGEFIAGPELTE